MNMPPTTPQRTAEVPTKAGETTREVGARDLQQRRELFERALRDKAGQQDTSDADDQKADAGCLALAALLAPPLTPRPAATHIAAGAAGIETVSTGPRAAIEAALNSSPGPHVTPIAGTEPAAVWEASVRESNSVPLEMRFTRPEQAATQGPQGWTLTIDSASAANVEMLARHAPRLNERLRKHAVGLDHVRIQHDEKDA